MAMEDVLPAILVIGVVWVVIRWLTGSKTPRAPGDGIPGVTPSMVATVHSAFPDVPVSNVIYHLSKTRSTQATSEEILERGFLPVPPPSFQIPTSLLPPTVNPPSAPPSPTPGLSSKSSSKPARSLIDRYGLSSRLSSLEKGKGKEVEPNSAGATNGSANGVGGGGAAAMSGGKWEDTKEKRERELKERKERMILEARRRLIEKQAKEAGSAAAGTA
ncbi:hypothetical protein JCM24511_00548 [Saitozyma sp. JCM 24511]|nr:hypothetical protein JCM24511_00548 [Saitozyma sp. JCM 24511]